MGQKMVRFAQLGAARSRQDEAIEVVEVGSKRPSSGCNGVHVVWWIGLIFRLLQATTGQCYRLAISRSTGKILCFKPSNTFPALQNESAPILLRQVMDGEASPWK